MSKIKLTLLGGAHDCVKPLFDGRVEPEGVELVATRMPPPEAMRRQLSTWEFDICEMAFGAYLIARAAGADVLAIPAFPMRSFFHTNFACHVDSRIDGPADFTGKRVGVPEYIMSAALWARGILQHDFGLELSGVKWYVERAGADSTGAVLGYNPPDGLDIQQTPGGRSLVSLLTAGELEAALIGNIADTTSGSPRKVRALFEDVVAEGKRFFDRHGYIPANHTYIIRGDIVRENPWVARSVFNAFREAKAVADNALPQSIPSRLIFGAEYLARTRRLFGDDPFQYGIDVNRAMLETVVRFSAEQGLIREMPTVDELFAPGVE